MKKKKKKQDEKNRTNIPKYNWNIKSGKCFTNMIYSFCYYQTKQQQ